MWEGKTIQICILLVLAQQISCYCYYGTEYKNGTGCFQFFRTPLNFTNALRFCRVNMESALVRSFDINKNEQLKDAAFKTGVEDFWIGSSNVNNDWLWLDGSQLNYSNFDVDAGYPMKTESQVGAVSMMSLSGKWYTKKDSMKLPFACEKQKTDDYDQGILYRAPKTKGLRFPYGGITSPLMVQAVDQSILYDQVGPMQPEQNTGDKIYLKPMTDTPGMNMNMEIPTVVIMNRRRVRKKLQPVIVSETETLTDRSLKEKEEIETGRNLTLKANSGSGTPSSSNSSQVSTENQLSETARKSKEIEANEKIYTKNRTIQRG